MTDEELQDVEDMLDGKHHLSDDEVLYWLRQDSRKMIQEIRRLKKEVAAKTEAVKG